MREADSKESRPSAPGPASRLSGSLTKRSAASLSAFSQRDVLADLGASIGREVALYSRIELKSTGTQPGVLVVDHDEMMREIYCDMCECLEQPGPGEEPILEAKTIGVSSANEALESLKTSSGQRIKLAILPWPCVWHKIEGVAVSPQTFLWYKKQRASYFESHPGKEEFDAKYPGARKYDEYVPRRLIVHGRYCDPQGYWEEDLCDLLGLFLESNPSLKIIVTSGSWGRGEMSQVRVELLRAGAFDFFPRPIEFEEFVSSIRLALRSNSDPLSVK